jgi:apolipoprotein N-acyltransferase
MALFIFLFAIAWPADKLRWATPTGESLKVALVQGNVPLTAKWQPDESTRIRDMYLQTSLTLPDRDLIVWPESALPFYVDEVEQTFWQTLREHPADFIFGLLEREPGGQPYYNSVVSISDDLEFYRKQHLVPFGEFLPLKPLFSWVVDYLEIPMADFTSWKPPQTALSAANQKAGISVCYEDAFPLGVRAALPQATILVNVSEDAWFGDSLAPHQRLQMAQMRAMETARPFIRAANTGISAVIDERGNIVSQTPQFQFAVLQSHVQPMTGATPFVRFGNAPMLVMTFALGFFGVLLTRLKKAQPDLTQTKIQ